MKKKNSGIKKKKLTLSEFVWYGFNFTTGIGFIGAFYVSANVTNDGKTNPYSIGMHSLWVFLLLGIIAGICAYGFSKMARVHHSNNNGGAYIYARTTFGRFVGFMITFLQYVGLPFLVTVQILYLVKGSFNPNFSGSTTIAVHWGPFTDLYLDILGVFIYLTCASLIYLGIKWYKRTNNFTSFFKWLPAFLLVGAAIYLCFQAGSTNINYWSSSKHSKLTLTGFLYTFNSFFFYFAGFETFSTAGRNIENPERNIGRGIIIIMIACTIFYIVIGFIFFASYQTFAQNMQLGAWDAFHKKGTNNYTPVLFWIGTIGMISGTFFLKMQASIQNALYGGTLLQPLAKEGYISDKFRKLNKDNLPIRAISLNLIITSIVIMFWLIIPDIISGVMTLNGKGKDGITTYTSYLIPGYNIATFTAMSSAITIFIYVTVLIAILHLGVKDKIKISLWEWIAFIGAVIFLIFIFGFHYYLVIYEKLIKVKKPIDAVSSIIELAFTLLAIVAALLIYFIYYAPKYKARLVSKPEIQKRLDKEFKVIDDWAYISLELEREVKNYLKRNLALHKNKTNSNYKLAAGIDKELQAVIKEYNAIIEERKKHDNEHIDE